MRSSAPRDQGPTSMCQIELPSRPPRGTTPRRRGPRRASARPRRGRRRPRRASGRRASRSPRSPAVSTTNAMSREDVSWVGACSGESSSSFLPSSTKRTSGRFVVRSSSGSASARRRRGRRRFVRDERRASRRRASAGRDDDRAHLEAREDDLDPVDVRAGEDEDGVARPHAALAQEPRPARRALREDMERARLDDAVLADERDRAALGILREPFDDVAREVEAVGHLPAALVERGMERELEPRQRQSVALPPATADSKLFHGPDIIDANCPEAERFRPLSGGSSRSAQTRPCSRPNGSSAGSASGRRKPPASSSAAMRASIGGCVLKRPAARGRLGARCRRLSVGLSTQRWAVDASA